ncbi:hypothetical protein [Rhizobium leguminosarum]|uniref:hypothetical protein n=1 Tax=Rhizobium leguminosarum TaxID=384 RepID=UPI003F9DB0DD
MLNAAVFDAEEFLKWITGKSNVDTRNSSVSTLKKSLKTEFCAIIASGNARTPTKEGVFFVVDERRSREFFAFVSTYVTEYLPFTAYFRVLSSDHLDLVDQEVSEFGFVNAVAKARLNAFVGVAIAEAAVYLNARGNEDGKSITLAAVTATYSGAALQGLAAGPATDIGAIGRSWGTLRSAIGSDKLPLRIDRLERFWGIVHAALFGGGSPYIRADEVTIVRTLRRVIESGRIEDDVVSEFLGEVPEIGGKLSRFRGTREDRTRAVQEAIATISDSNRLEGELRDSIAGFLLSLLGDGSFKFLSLALSIASVLPMAPLWFAAWSGAQKSTDVMTTFNCLGRRVARDLHNSAGLFAVPVDDIAIGELQTGGFDLDAIPRAYAGSISVELYPNISSRQGLPRSGSASSQTKANIHNELRELRALFAQSAAVLAKIEGLSAESDSDKPHRNTTKGDSLRGRRSY